jgi:hypothetical protein
LLLFWAVPLPIFAQIPRFGVYEDSIMLVIGIYGLIMLVKNWKGIGKEINENQRQKGSRLNRHIRQQYKPWKDD